MRQGKTKQREKQRERRKAKEREAGTRNKTTFLVQIFFERLFPSFYYLLLSSVSENNYISSKLYLFIKRTAHHHTKGVLLRDINKHTRTA